MEDMIFPMGSVPVSVAAKVYGPLYGQHYPVREKQAPSA